MGLLNKKNLTKAKDLALKNKDKVAAGVTKATEAIDKKTGGKHTDKLKKLDDAAAKFAGKPESGGAVSVPADATGPDSNEAPPASE
jgi:hypothetical protein